MVKSLPNASVPIQVKSFLEWNTRVSPWMNRWRNIFYSGCRFFMSRDNWYKSQTKLLSVAPIDHWLSYSTDFPCIVLNVEHFNLLQKTKHYKHISSICNKKLVIKHWNRKGIFHLLCRWSMTPIKICIISGKFNYS